MSNDAAQNVTAQEPLGIRKSPDRVSAITTAKFLGYAGLLPFVFLALASLMGLHLPFAPSQALLIGYGAVILTFVGALHWGAQMASGAPSSWAFIWSVIPSLMGWVALMVPAGFAALIIIIGLITCWAIDRRAIAKGIWPSWMGSMRTILTAIACLSMMVIYLPLLG
ncbi:MAG: DUF3429 domain-containing protein [Candidatus Puniceispirillaceae bacterium]